MAAVPQASISLRDMSLFREQAFIAGRWESAANGQVKQVSNPATGQLLGTVPNMGAARRGARSRRLTKRCPTGGHVLRKSARRSCASGST